MELIIEPRSVGSDGPTLVLSGAVDLVTRDALVEAGTTALARGGNLSLDMGGVTFIDSTGIGALVKLHTLAQSNGGELRIPQRSGCVTRVLEVTGLAEAWAT